MNPKTNNKNQFSINPFKLMKDETHSYSILSNMVHSINEEQCSIYDDIMCGK